MSMKLILQGPNVTPTTHATLESIGALASPKAQHVIGPNALRCDGVDASDDVRSKVEP